MPRTQRQKSASGIYHVMIRGINRQRIFEDDEDNLKILECLQKYKAGGEFKLYAYCLMGNHLHLLINEKDDNLSQILKQVGTRFVYWYNWKYQRSGHLFQDRFKSEPVENDPYFLSVLRYIHLNPVNAKLCSDPSDYRYSSYRAYLRGTDGFVDTSFALVMIDRDEFIRYHHEENDDKCLEYESSKRISDNEAQDMIKNVTGYKDPGVIQALALLERNDALRRLKAERLSIRQISRLTGVSKKIVERA